jgi:hypothetical protein
MWRHTVKFGCVYVYFILIVYSFIYMCIHCLGHLSPLPISSLPLTPIPSLTGRTCSALFSNFVEEKIKEIIRKT